MASTANNEVEVAALALLARIHELCAAYNPDQERDAGGRWGSGGSPADHSTRAYRATRKAEASGSVGDHQEAASLHRDAAIAHKKEAALGGPAKAEHLRSADMHTQKGAEHGSKLSLTLAPPPPSVRAPLLAPTPNNPPSGHGSDAVTVRPPRNN